MARRSGVCPHTVGLRSPFGTKSYVRVRSGLLRDNRVGLRGFNGAPRAIRFIAGPSSAPGIRASVLAGATTTTRVTSARCWAILIATSAPAENPITITESPSPAAASTARSAKSRYGFAVNDASRPTDAQLDRNYQALISHLKSEAGTRRGAAEPLTVQRLRAAQRSWLVYRDDECRKRTVEQEGPLWAPVRAKCLAEYSALRSRELEDALAKRKTVSRRPAPPKSKPASRSKRARSSKRRG
jgi:uncharacterized protein YecT (DUF1311 family)